MKCYNVYFCRGSKEQSHAWNVVQVDKAYYVVETMGDKEFILYAENELQDQNYKREGGGGAGLHSIRYIYNLYLNY